RGGIEASRRGSSGNDAKRTQSIATETEGHWCPADAGRLVDSVLFGGGFGIPFGYRRGRFSVRPQESVIASRSALMAVGFVKEIVLISSIDFLFPPPGDGI